MPSRTQRLCFRFNIRSPVFKRLITVASLIGFLCQVIQVSIQYFAYKTTTQVKIKSPELITAHSVAICIRYGDILNKTRLKKDAGITFKPLRELSDGIRQENLLTVDQIFEYTPNEFDLIIACFSRPDNWRYTINNNGTECYKWFNVTRFFTLEFMCYNIEESRENQARNSDQVYKSYQ